MCVYELALEGSFTHIDTFIPFKKPITSAKLTCRGALALLLTSQAIRAEFGEGVLPRVAAHCEDFRSRVKILELEWEMKVAAPVQPQPGWRVIDVPLQPIRLQRQRDLELGNAHVATQTLSKVKYIMERAVEEFKPNLEPSSGVEDQSFKADV